MKHIDRIAMFELTDLSVSSNGSTWVKLDGLGVVLNATAPFSILERIDVGETFAGGE